MAQRVIYKLSRCVYTRVHIHAHTHTRSHTVKSNKRTATHFLTHAQHTFPPLFSHIHTIKRARIHTHTHTHIAQLIFNIPVFKSKVPLTGKLVLKRGADGLFTS